MFHVNGNGHYVHTRSVKSVRFVCKKRGNMGKETAADIKPKGNNMAALSKSYLVLYNSIQTAGWGYILIQTLRFLIKHKSAVGLWKICSTSVIVFQTLAALEVLHTIVRLVPANPVVTAVQVASRVMQVWGIMMPIEKVHDSPTLALTLLAWSITEVVRYSYYCSQLLGKPSWLHSWCRYTFFYVLYPAGVIGEVGNIFFALDTIKKKQLYSILLPNPLNISFSYYYANILIVLSYIPLFPQLFFHMVRQRKKVLGETSKKEK